jgi:hypothetical protein
MRGPVIEDDVLKEGFSVTVEKNPTRSQAVYQLRVGKPSDAYFESFDARCVWHKSPWGEWLLQAGSRLHG